MIRRVCSPQLLLCSRLRGLSKCAFATIVFLLLIGRVPALAQTDLEDIHVAPRTKPVATPEKELDPSLDTHTKPLIVDVNLVLVPVTITDTMDRMVLGLDRENFQVYENKELQAIQHFSREDVPISLGVLFDTSGSMASNTKIEKAREAVVEFLKTANPQDEFFMYSFADKPDLISDFTSSVEEIQNKLVYAIPKGRTALLDAIYLGISKMRQAKYEKRALLIISDGGDNHSRYSENEIRNLIKEADVQIYAIGVYDHSFPTEEERLGPELLGDISELTGGRAFAVDNPNELTDVASKIGVELRNQYVIGYRPKGPTRDGKWHKIRVKLMPPKGLPRLRIYAKKGYYAASD